VLQAVTLEETLEMGGKIFYWLSNVSWVNGFKLFDDTQVRTGQQEALLEFLKLRDLSTGGDNQENKLGRPWHNLEERKKSK